MDTDSYAEFAERYDLFFGPFGEHDPTVVDFYRRLFARHNVRSVLDCACGTGRELHLFHSLGVEAVGSDASEAMLARARENLLGAGVEVPLHRVDYRDLPTHFEQRFDAVACLSTSIAHMPDEENLLRAFQSMRAALREGGILVMTQGTSDRQWAEKPRFMLAVSDRDFSRLFVIDYLGERSARYNVLDVIHTADRHELKHWSTEYPCLLLRDDQERLLRTAGFAKVEFYGAYDFTPYNKETSPRLITVAQKLGGGFTAEQEDEAASTPEQPSEATRSITLRQLAERLRNTRPDDRFADDMESIQAEQSTSKPATW